MLTKNTAVDLRKIHSYHEILREVLNQKQKNNPGYSLRAFARDIDVSPSRLSEILNQGLPISIKKAETVAKKIFHDYSEQRYFVDLVTSQVTKNGFLKNVSQERVKSFRDSASVHTINKDEFELISEWYHLAILEAIQLPSFNGDIDWIAHKLGIHPKQVLSTLTKLEALGIISYEDEKLITVHNTNKVQTKVKSDSILKYHKQMIAKAHASVDEQHMDERELGALTIAIDRSQLPKLKRMLVEMRAKFDQETSQSQVNPDSIYCLSMQFFRLSTEE